MFLGPGAQKPLYIKVLGTQNFVPPGSKNHLFYNVFGTQGPKTFIYKGFEDPEFCAPLGFKAICFIMFLGPRAQKPLYIKVLGTPDPPGPKNLIKTNVFGPWVQKTLVFIRFWGPGGQSVFLKKNLLKTNGFR